MLDLSARCLQICDRNKSFMLYRKPCLFFFASFPKFEPNLCSLQAGASRPEFLWANNGRGYWLSVGENQIITASAVLHDAYTPEHSRCEVASATFHLTLVSANKQSCVSAVSTGTLCNVSSSFKERMTDTHPSSSVTAKFDQKDLAQPAALTALTRGLCSCQRKSSKVHRNKRLPFLPQ